MKLREFAVGLALFQAVLIFQANAEEFGKFSGDWNFSWSEKDRTMKVLEDVGFVDLRGVEWKVPANTSTDGASIPQVFWSVIGGPFDGLYRKAAVIHDHFCVTRTRGWRDTHRVLYEAARAAGVGATKAKTIYAAVYYFGPRWGEPGTGTRGPGDDLDADVKRARLDEIQAFIENEHPNLDEIDAKMEAL